MSGHSEFHWTREELGPTTMLRLAPTVRLLQAPLGGWVVPKAHIYAKPARTPTSPTVGPSKAAGAGAGAGAGEAWQGQGKWAVPRCSQDEVALGRDTGGERGALSGLLVVGLSPSARSGSQVQERGPCSHCLQASLSKQPTEWVRGGGSALRTPLATWPMTGTNG